MTQIAENLYKYLILETQDFWATKIDFVSKRVLSYWIQRGIVEPIHSKGKRRRLSYIELCWLRLVKELRDYEIGFDVIIRIKESLFEELDINESNLLNFSGLQYLLELFEKQGPLSKVSLNDLAQKMDSVYQQIPPTKTKFTNLEYYILESIALQTPISLLVNLQGKIVSFIEIYQSDYFADKKFLEFFRATHISISISSINTYFFENGFEDLIYKSIPLNPHELELIEILKKENPTEVTIRYKQGVPDLIEITAANAISVNAKIYEILRKGAYEEINISINNGQISYSSKTKKIKFNKGTR
ncbi:hypothetical protein BH11BAC3_BH11BAC3_19780 [soil metagenome]